MNIEKLQAKIDAKKAKIEQLQATKEQLDKDIEGGDKLVGKLSNNIDKMERREAGISDKLDLEKDKLYELEEDLKQMKMAQKVAPKVRKKGKKEEASAEADGTEAE